ncbi:MAG: autotransporter domain-containing protein [Candidatus Omnitrophota bacterium]
MNINGAAGTVTLNGASNYITTTNFVNPAAGAILSLAPGITLNGSITTSNPGIGIVEFQTTGGTAATINGNIGGGNALAEVDVYQGSSAINGNVTATNFAFKGNGGSLTVGAGYSITTANPITVTTPNSSTITYLGSTTIGQDLATAGNKFVNINFRGGLVTLGANLYSLITTVDSASLDLTGDRTVGTALLSLVNAGSITGAGKKLTLVGGYFDMQSGAASAILDGAVDLTKTTAGTVTLSGANTFSGRLTVEDGKLAVATINNVSANGTLGNSALAVILGTAGGNTGTLQYTGNTATSTKPFTMTTGGTGAFQIDTATQILSLDGIIDGGGNLTKTGAGILDLGGANTYTGATTVNAGMLRAGIANVAFGVGSAVTVATGATLNLSGGNQTIGSLAGAGTITSDGVPATLTAGGDNTSTTFSGIINSVGATVALTKTGAGTLTLSGANTYSGATAINAGTVVASNASALGNGSAVTVANGATLDVGTTNVTVNAIYTQQAGSNFNLTIASPSSSGKITSNANATVAATSTVNVTVASGSYIASKTTFTVVDGSGGAGVNVPGTITSSDPRLKFSGLSLNGDLILTVDRSASGFSSLGTNSNSSAVGATLDNITTPSTDMTTVLNTLEGLSNSQTASALDTVTPTVDNGVTNTSNTSIIQFIGTSTDRLEGLFVQAHNEETGVSTGSKGSSGFEAWGRGFGEYAHQDPRGISNGYHATIWGTAIGGDLPIFNDRARLGVSGGYAASDINSKDNSGATNINSYQSAFYGGYIDRDKPYYINGAFSFAYNTYRGKRNIDVGAIRRIANSSYRGQQYSVLFDGGYTFKTKQVNITPIASLQYIHLHIQSYTETGADALNLSVASQDYDLLETGLGAKLDRSFDVSYGRMIPEVHVKWLYDAITDKQATTSTFSGGGGSFATNGFTPARNALNVGGRLALVTKGNWSFDANYDFEYKQDFTSHTGWADVRYSF